ncbi:MAG: hypothetical protein WC729_05110 [Sphingomonas sp.]|jgi:hypothetical protein|uniref:hypothetical protein n=1 Tax=Sphingomonas sp. TaxID=28214 RepID=UPI0035693DC9
MLVRLRSFTSGQRRFETLVDGYALVLAETAGALIGAFSSSAGDPRHVVIKQNKTRADALSRALRTRSARRWSAPDERIAVFALLDALDSAMADIDRAARTALGVETDPALGELERALIDAIDVVAAALPFLRSTSTYRPQLRLAATDIAKLGERAAALHVGGLRALSRASPDAAELAVRHDIYARLECIRHRLTEAGIAIERLPG